MLDKKYSEYLHISHATCTHSLRVLAAAEALGCCTYVIKADTNTLPPSLEWDGALFYFDMEPGVAHVPSRHFRKLRPRDIEHGRVVVPAWIVSRRVLLGQLIAVNTITATHPGYEHRMRQALMDLHVRDFGRTPEPAREHAVHTDWRGKRKHTDAREWAGGWL